MAKAIAKVVPQCPVGPINSEWISKDLNIVSLCQVNLVQI